MSTELEITVEPARGGAACELIGGLDRELMKQYPGLPVNGIEAEDFEARGGVFAVGRVGGSLAACGAFRVWEGAAEIKRMFVAPQFRGRGFGRAMLRFLEGEAARRGFKRAVLETGTRQVEAMALYESEGWRVIPQFGPYLTAKMSVCYGKSLGA